MSGKHIFSVNVDFSQRELLNAVLQNLFQAPLVPIEGQVYYDSFYNVPHYWDENEWIPWQRPVHKDYVSQVSMIADQQYQLKKFIYFDGTSYWEYLGTTNGDISDYRPFTGSGGGGYVHPTYTPYDLTLTGATVIENIETDTIGSVVNLTVRELQLSDLGYSGDTNADYYGSWILNVNGTQFYVVESENIINIQAGDNITLDTSGNTLTISSQDTIYVHPSYTGVNLTLTGATVISTIVTDDIGSVVDVQTRELTLLDLGYSGDTNADYYGNWVLNINGSEFYVVESENIINIQAGDNITLNTSGNTLTISSQDTIYTHPIYTGISLTLTGSTVISTIITDEIGSVVEVTTRSLTPEDIGAEPAFNKGNIIIPIDSGLSYTGTTTDRLVGSGDLTIVNDDKGSDQNIFKEIRDISGNTAISATTNNDFIQIEGRNGTEVSFESGNKIIIDTPEQDNFVRIYEISASEFDFNDPIIPQVVDYVNNLIIPIELTQTDSKINILIKNETINEECEVIIELINKGKGLYGNGNNQITENDLLIIEDNCGLCCDNFVRVLYVPCEFVDFNLPLKPQIATYINQLDPPLVIEKTDSKYNIVIDCEQTGTTVTCENGMDVLFLLDYTSSMQDTIDLIKQNINIITQNISEISGGNYRLALAIFDEYTLLSNINYSNSTFYNDLLTNGQVYINNGNNTKQIITLITDFSNNNLLEFETNINKIRVGSTNIPENFPLGDGNGLPEPYDLALDVCINGTPFTGTTRTEFLSPFRNNVNKQIILITDDLPSGTNDGYGSIDVDFINGQLKNDILNKNIKLSLLSILNRTVPTSQNLNLGIFLETFTFDGFSRIFTLNNIPIGLLNIKINTNTVSLTPSQYSVNNLNKTVTILNTVNLVSGDQVKIIYRTNAILNIVKQSNGIFSNSYSPDTINETISLGCIDTPVPTIIYEITGLGLGNTELSSCLNYSPTQKLYTYCENISLGCELYYDDEGSVPVTDFDYISINDIVYSLSNFGEIASISSFNCNDIITTFIFSGTGRANISQDACDDATTNNRTLYSDCEIIDSGCIIYTDTYGLNPLTGYSKIFIDNQVWDISDTTGTLSNVSSTQCTNPNIIYTQTNSGYGNTSQDACDDATANNRILYSDCSLITSGCTIYTDSAGNIELTGYTSVYIDGKVWDINNTTGVIIAFSSTQCALPELIAYTGCGYGNSVSTACNDAIINNRTLYSDCSFVEVNCEIYTDINGTIPLTGYNYVSINSTIWELNLGNVVVALSPIQC